MRYKGRVYPTDGRMTPREGDIVFCDDGERSHFGVVAQGHKPDPVTFEPIPNGELTVWVGYDNHGGFGYKLEPEKCILLTDSPDTMAWLRWIQKGQPEGGWK